MNPIWTDQDGIIIAGHARLAAAKKLRLEKVPVIVLRHLNEAQKQLLALADNQLPAGAYWDEEMLGSVLQSLMDQKIPVDLIGLPEKELARLVAADLAALTEENAVPDAPALPVSVRRDIWTLGEHFVMCGDATDLDDVRRLMDGQLADLVFTDPPYNVDYEGYTEDKLKIQGDCMSKEQFETFLHKTFLCYRSVTKNEASIYVFHPSSGQREFQDALEQAGFSVRCQIVWVKNTFAWGFGRYKFRHEPIFYAHVAEQKDNWYGDKSQSTVWEENKPLANRQHPTAKPVELVERALLNSSRPGDIVVDLFGGSGSTLIGCERHGRKARLMEIDPAYVDVIIKRWQDQTGQLARLSVGNSTYDEIADHRLKVAA